MSQATTDRAIYRSEARAIVRCTEKGCRRAHTLAFATEREVWAFNGRMAERRYLVTGDRRVPYRDRYDLAHAAVARFVCTGCGNRRASFDVIQGHFTESVKCGARCRGAVGPSCDCSCGGERHGEGHAAL